ncbi:MAG: glycosyltransferase family 4 protein [Oligosphaeraceae bacterium]
MTWILLQLLLWGAATLLTAVLMPLCRRVALRRGLMDRPCSEGHKNHAQATPVVGGVAMALVWFPLLGLGLLGAVLLAPCLPPALATPLQGLRAALPSLATVAFCALVLALMGYRDDRARLSAKAKLAVQLGTALLTALLGPRILVGVVPLWLSWLLTALWIATVVNAMNFFDNMNGLAGGVAVIAFAFLFAIAALRGQLFVGALNALSGGVALGFLFHNFPKAKVFMGDCGSHLLGYLLAVSCILTTFYHPENTPSLLALTIPLLVLAVPLLDAITVVMIRLRLHKPIYVGDNRHLSHRFVALGLSRLQAVLAIWLLSLLAGTGALSLLWTPPMAAFLILAQMLAMVTLILLIQLGAHPPE